MEYYEHILHQCLHTPEPTILICVDRSMRHKLHLSLICPEEDAGNELAQLQPPSPSFSLKDWEGAVVKYLVKIEMAFCRA
jgi:hypothetical protein